MKIWIFVYYCMLGAYAQSGEGEGMEYKFNGMEIISYNDPQSKVIDFASQITQESGNGSNNSTSSSQTIDEEVENPIIKRLIEMLSHATSDNAMEQPNVETVASPGMTTTTPDENGIPTARVLSDANTSTINVLLQKLEALPPPAIDQLLNLLNVSFPNASNETPSTNEITTQEVDTMKIDVSVESTSGQMKMGRSGFSESLILPIAIFSNSSSGSEVISSLNVSQPMQNVSESTMPNTTITYNRYDDTTGSHNITDTEGYIPDYFVFAVLRNGTIIRKRPNRVIPNVLYGFLEDGTLVKKFPNGSMTVVPMGPVIQVIGFDTREFPPSMTENEIETNPQNVTAIEEEFNPGPIAVRISFEDGSTSIVDGNATEATTSSSVTMTSEVLTTLTVASPQSTTNRPEMTEKTTSAVLFTNPIGHSEEELWITEAVPIPLINMQINDDPTPVPSSTTPSVTTMNLQMKNESTTPFLTTMNLATTTETAATTSQDEMVTTRVFLDPKTSSINFLIQKLEALPSTAIDQLFNLLNVSVPNETDENSTTVTTQAVDTIKNDVSVSVTTTSDRTKMGRSVLIDSTTPLSSVTLTVNDEFTTPSSLTATDLQVNDISTTKPSIPEQHLPQNFHLREQEKHDLLLIESLIKKQQAALQQLTLLTQLRLEDAESRQSETLTQRVISMVMGMMPDAKSKSETPTTTSLPPTTTLATTVQPSPISPTPVEDKEKMTTTSLPPTTTLATTLQPSSISPTPVEDKEKMIPLISQKQIQILIQQLETIKKNPEKIKKLDLGALKKLQKFENVMVTMKTPTGESAEVLNKEMDLSESPKTEPQLTDYAVNISSAISSFFGSALQNASEKFVSSLRFNSTNLTAV